MLSAVRSEATRLRGCGTVTSPVEAPTGVCHILTASQLCCIVVRSAEDMLQERGSYIVSKWANTCYKHGKKSICCLKFVV